MKVQYLTEKQVAEITGRALQTLWSAMCSGSWRDFGPRPG